MPKRIVLARGLAKRLLPLALVIYFLIGVGFPVLYYTIESKALSRKAGVYAQEFSDKLRKLTLLSPGLWKYEAEKYMEVIRSFLPHKDISAIWIVDEKGNVISSYETGTPARDSPLPSSVGGSAPIISNNHILGGVRISVSTAGLIHETFVMFLFCTVLGAVLTVLVFFFPVNVARGMERQIKELVGALRQSGEESERLRLAAEESERRFRYLIEGLDAIVWEAKAGSNDFTFVSGKAEKLLGYPLLDWYKPDFLRDHIFPDDREKTLALYGHLTLGRNNVNEFEYRIMASDGRIIWIRDKVRLSPAREGAGPQLQGLMVDITESRLYTDALTTEKERLAVTLKSIVDGVITTDTGGMVVSMNRVAEQLTGYSWKEGSGRHLNDIFRIMDENRQWFINPLDGAFAGKSHKGSAAPALLVAADSTECLIERTITPMRNSQGREIGNVLVFRDMTERRKMEEELLKIQKLESIRVLAGGIAHDFNNLLTSIIGNISIAKRHASGGSRLLGILTDLDRASFLAQDLTTRLLTFSKGGAPVKKVAALSDIIRQSTDFALRGSQLVCKFMIPDDLWPAEVDVGQISQVINNIVINASQAMPDGGAIEIHAGNVETGPELPLLQGPCVRISVRDHGAGVPEKYISKIFDPFFTTKQDGSGLGLATAYSIVRKHNGHITVESREAKGATFNIYLPASDRDVPTAEEEGKVLLAGKGRVLVMDDENIVRLIADGMLKELGYQSDTAEDGDQTIEKYSLAREEGRPFDVVIIDLTIRGGIGGTETIRRLREVDPAVKAIVSSGYSDNPVMSNFREYGFKDVITKPYRIEDLSEVLYKVIYDITEYHH